MEIDFNINGFLAARDANVSPVLTSIAVYRSCRIQGSAKRLRPGCVNAAGKLRQEW